MKKQRIAATQQLHDLIRENLSPLIGRKCILLDAPYHHNIGDVLIWIGEMAFIKESGGRCLYTASYETCTFPAIDKETTVVVQGGGNVGDIYHEHVEFLLEVTSRYPDNRIVVCPQTVFYENQSQMKSDFEKLSQHKDLYLCARDSVTFDLLKLHFGEHALLLPDMAFCIPTSQLDKYRLTKSKQKLFIERKDCESKVGDTCGGHEDGDVSDWPTFEHSFRRTTFLNKIFKRAADANIPVLTKLSNRLWDKHFRSFFAEAMMEEGVRFISPYMQVETTRMHGCILAVLLGKEVILRDNSYGKNSNFYNTWLRDFSNVTLVDA